MQEVFKKIIMKLGIRAEKSEKKEMDAEHFEYAQMYKGERIAFGDAIEIVKQGAEKFGTDTNVGSNGWIPCSERLPDSSCDVIITTHSLVNGVGSYFGEDSGWIQWYSGGGIAVDVVAWQPLPEPYKET